MMKEETLSRLTELKTLLEALKVFVAEGTINMEYNAKVKDKIAEEVNQILEAEFGLLKPEEEVKTETITEKAEEEAVVEETPEETPTA